MMSFIMHSWYIIIKDMEMGVVSGSDGPTRGGCVRLAAATGG